MSTASTGWITRRRMSRCEVGERSARSASAIVCDGKSVSPSAAMAPLTPTNSSASVRPVTVVTVPERRLALTGAAPDSQCAVNVIAATSRKVFTRCTAMNIARAMLALSATSSNNTSAAPTPASVSMKNIDHAAARLAACPAGQTRKVHHITATTPRSARPLVRRCEYSTSVCRLASRGITWPLHKGQWLPHPAPAPVARTYAPHRMTATV